MLTLLLLLPYSLFVLNSHWAMERFDLFADAPEGGLAYADELLRDDVWNNSAWNHRYFVMLKTKRFEAVRLSNEKQRSRYGREHT